MDTPFSPAHLRALLAELYPAPTAPARRITGRYLLLDRPAAEPEPGCASEPLARLLFDPEAPFGPASDARRAR